MSLLHTIYRLAAIIVSTCMCCHSTLRTEQDSTDRHFISIGYHLDLQEVTRLQDHSPDTSREIIDSDSDTECADLSENICFSH